MNPLEAFLLGILQGLTEFLPVSSSGHLVLGGMLLGAEEPGMLFEVVVHLATLVAVMTYYRARIWEIIAGLAAGGESRRSSLRFVALLAAASIPAGLVGLLLRKWIERAFDSPLFASSMLIVTGFVLLSTRFARGAGDAPVTPLRGMTAGFAQAVAILPGISRSGSTISAALWTGAGGKNAAEFSFMLSIPAVAGAGLLALLDLDAARVNPVPLAAAGIAALATGYVSLGLLTKVLEKNRLFWFGPYCIAAGILGMALCLLRP